MGNNTKTRSEQIFQAALIVLENAGGFSQVDDLPQPERYIILQNMYQEVVSVTGCVRETARRNVAKALRRARYGEVVRRGGARPGPHPGRPKKAPSE